MYSPNYLPSIAIMEHCGVSWGFIRCHCKCAQASMAWVPHSWCRAFLSFTYLDQQMHYFCSSKFCAKLTVILSIYLFIYSLWCLVPSRNVPQGDGYSSYTRATNKNTTFKLVNTDFDALRELRWEKSNDSYGIIGCLQTILNGDS